MLALRTRAACVARRSRPTSLRTARSYASESGHSESSHGQSAEGLGTPFYVFAGAIPLSMLAYSISRPGENGEPPALTTWLRSFGFLQDEYETRNLLRTQAIEQAAHDKHLFMNSGGDLHIDLRDPELIFSGSPRNVPAGFYPNMDHLLEHYRKQAIEEEQRKMKKLAAKKEKEQKS
ncbi:hypothetical protein F4780DRAFT_737505 [Xylariomycetidae sp. FL0641]|nr:hypothetical protein F4780DRAFT_737505 [Xylariomycetidae sp. FL0641]